MVKLSWVTYLEKNKKKNFQGGENCEDFSKWCKMKRFFEIVLCNGQLIQVKNTKIFQRDEKYEDFSKW